MKYNLILYHYIVCNLQYYKRNYRGGLYTFTKLKSKPKSTDAYRYDNFVVLKTLKADSLRGRKKTVISLANQMC